jgi:hypothetical protein
MRIVNVNDWQIAFRIDSRSILGWKHGGIAKAVGLAHRDSNIGFQRSIMANLQFTTRPVEKPDAAQQVRRCFTTGFFNC